MEATHDRAPRCPSVSATTPMATRLRRLGERLSVDPRSLAALRTLTAILTLGILIHEASHLARPGAAVPFRAAMPLLLAGGVASLGLLIGYYARTAAALAWLALTGLAVAGALTDPGGGVVRLLLLWCVLAPAAASAWARTRSSTAATSSRSSATRRTARR